MTGDREQNIRHVYVCVNTDCSRRGNEAVHAELAAAFENADDVMVHEYVCFGNCDNGGNVIVLPDRVWIGRLRGQGGPVRDYLVTGDFGDKHKNAVDQELADAMYEILELETAQEEGEASDLQTVPN